VTQIVESVLADASRLLPLAAGVVVAYMVLRTWVKTRSAGSTVVAVVVGALVVGFLSNPDDLTSMLWSEIQARAGT
jgi:hypothetical protein